MSDRVAVMNRGRFVQVDTPERLHDRPADAFVAQFIGEATLLPVLRAGLDAVKLGETVLRSARPIPDGERLHLVTHSEKLSVADGKEDAGWNRLTGTVTETLYQGESICVFFRLAGGQDLSLRLPGNHVGRARLRQPGETIAVALHREDTIIVPDADAPMLRPSEQAKRNVP